MSRAVAIAVRRVLSLALFLTLGGLLFADLSHFRTGGNSSDTSVFTNERFHVGDPERALTNLFLSCNGLVFTDANNARVVLPGSPGIFYNTAVIPTIGGPGSRLERRSGPSAHDDQDGEGRRVEGDVGHHRRP